MAKTSKEKKIRQLVNDEWIYLLTKSGFLNDQNSETFRVLINKSLDV